MMQREAHMSPEALLDSLQFKKGDFGKIALVSGQKQRAQACLKHMENPVKNFTFLGYTFWTGSYKGKKITVGNGGFYAPDSAFITELLAVGGIEKFIRLGSCGALREDIGVGDYIVADQAIRGDGATKYYVDDDFIPTADKEISLAVKDLASRHYPVHQGSVWTTDALFRETKNIVNSYIKKGAIGVDMVTSPFLTVANLYNKKTAAILSVSDNLITGELGFNNYKFFESQLKMVEVAFQAAEEI
jgi:DeoD family purine-nucleoside phosphorylase